MSAIFPIQGSFTRMFNPTEMAFSAISESVCGHAIGITAQTVILPDGGQQVHACFVVQGRDPAGKIMHWVVPVIDFEVDRVDRVGTVHW